MAALAEIVTKCVDDRRHPVPFRLLRGELTASSGGDAVEPRLPAGVRGAPLATYEAALLQPHESRIESTHIQLERATRGLFQPGGECVPMKRTEHRQRPQDHQIERALEHVGFGTFSIGHANEMYAAWVGMSNGSHRDMR